MDDEAAMARALELAASARIVAHPNPWVGAVVAAGPGLFEGVGVGGPPPAQGVGVGGPPPAQGVGVGGPPPAQGVTETQGVTEAPGGRHAEVVALDAAGTDLVDATLYVTLEPCVDFPGKRTASCASRIVEQGVRRVVVAMADPDPRVAGRGIEALRAAGIEVEVGLLADRARELLAPYVHQRTTGRPYVVLKLAASLDGRIAAPDGTSRWITGPEARADAHRLRAESDAIVVGAGTVRADDPSLTVRLVDGPDPRRIVLGRAPAGAKVQPCEEFDGDPAALLDRLGAEGLVQVMVEGGATVAGAFHRAGLVDRYVIYLAPVLFGGEDARPMFAGPGAESIEDVFRGDIIDVVRLGSDLRIDVARG